MVAPLKVGVAGLGTVGAAVLRMLAEQRATLSARCGRPIEVVAVTARSRAKKRQVSLKNIEWVKDPVTLARHPKIDTFVELIGGEGDPAKAAVEAALQAGKSVVTANKALLAEDGATLYAAAEKHGVDLYYEASVAGDVDSCIRFHHTPTPHASGRPQLQSDMRCRSGG